MKDNLDPAATIIRLCGGPEAVARLTGRGSVRVRRWAYPKERQGAGGLIPMAAATTLMRRARAEGLPLRPEHFFPEDEGGGGAEG